MTYSKDHGNDPEVAALYLAGGTGKSIGRRFGISDVAVYNALKRQGIPRRRSGRQAAWEGNEQDRRELVAAYVAGNGISVLARKFKINKRRVTQVLEEAGVTWRHAGGKLRFSDEEAAEIARAYLAGESMKQIARRHEADTKVIRDCVIRAGVQLRPLGAPAFWTEDRKTEAVQRYQTGEQLQDIAAAMGCGRDSLTGTLVELGVHEKKHWELRGEDHHAWRGGRVVDSAGYIRIKVTAVEPLLADEIRGGYMMEHRLVMARLLGRRLLKSETVHHVNGNRQDNRPENLQLRQGKHGRGSIFRCAACGSHNIEAIYIAGD